MQACTHSAPSTVEMFSAAQLDPIRDRMISHPVLTAIHDIPSLRKSWKRTCSPCGDFMSLLKGLQRELTRIDLLWMPRADAHAAQLINQIVPGEESDAGPGGEAASHWTCISRPCAKLEPALYSLRIFFGSSGMVVI